MHATAEQSAVLPQVSSGINLGFLSWGELGLFFISWGGGGGGGGGSFFLILLVKAGGGGGGGGGGEVHWFG